ncbi:MAG: hypothetical protein ABL995_07140 [Bryobacteraceae bacterium]
MRETPLPVSVLPSLCEKGEKGTDRSVQARELTQVQGFVDGDVDGDSEVRPLFTQSLPRGAITDVSGLISSGRTALLHQMLAEATKAGECCAVVDGRDAFDPSSAAAAGVDLKKLLWVRISGVSSNMSRQAAENKRVVEEADRAASSLNPIEKAMKAVDLILHSGGFGLVVLDLCETGARELNSIPLSYWYRFRRAVENTPCRLVVASHVPLVKTCAPLQLVTQRDRAAWQGLLFAGIESRVETKKQRAWILGQDLVTQALAG